MSSSDSMEEEHEVLVVDSLWSQSNLTAVDSTFAELEPYKNFLNASRFWVQRVFVPLLMVIGVIGNSITIVIMTRRRMRSSTNNYLAALAIFDLLYLFFTFVLGLRHYPQLHVTQYLIYTYIWKYSLMIADCCSNCSVWLTVTFTIERYIVVSHPIQGKIICTESRARKVVLCVFVICFVYTLPTPFEWEIREKFDLETNDTILYDLTESALGNNEIYKSIYYWLTPTLFVFVPLLLLAVFNSFLIRSVHISRKQRSDMTQSKSQAVSTMSPSTSPSKGRQEDGGEQNSNGRSRDMRSVMTTSGVASRLESASSKQETKITVMLIAVVILFFVCQMPAAVMLIFTSAHKFPEDSKEFLLILGLNNIFNFLLAINAAGNFLLYCFFSQRYRKTFVALFCPCIGSKLGYTQTATHPNTTVYSSRSTKSRMGKDRTTGGTEMSRIDSRGQRQSRTSSAKKSVTPPRETPPTTTTAATAPYSVSVTAYQHHDEKKDFNKWVEGVQGNHQPYV